MDKEEKIIGIEYADICLRFPEVMEEEFDDLTEFLEDEHIKYEGVTDVFIDLQDKVKKQKEVIYKAIKFLEEWGKEPDADMYMLMNEYKEFNELLDILKEVSE